MDLKERLTLKTIEYTGATNPEIPGDAQIEIAGLRNAIKQAEELISRWEQVLVITKIGEREERAKEEEQANADGQEEA